MSKKRLLFSLIILCFSLSTWAQDSLWVKKISGKPYVIHKVYLGEDIFLLSKKYAAPPAVIADANNLNYKSGLDKGKQIWIPIDNYNFIRIESVIKSRPIFYRVTNADELNDISKMIHVSQSTIQRWNHLDLPNIKSGQVLQIGWIAYDETQVPFADKKTTIAPDIKANTKNAPKVAMISKIPPQQKDSLKLKSDTTNITVNSPYEGLYEQQTNGLSIATESGAAVFYPLKIKAAEGVYYAFHNTATKGTIIKITNPSNGKFIYAKVIGTIPDLPDYHNSIIALSTNAAKGLLAQEKRMFCKIEHR